MSPMTRMSSYEVDSPPPLSNATNKYLYKTKSWRKRLASFLSALVLVGLVVIVALVAKKSSTRSKSSQPELVVNVTNNTATNISKQICPTIHPSQRTVAFWQSEVDGCTSIPVGVTHVVFGFALVKNGTVSSEFQTADHNIKECVKRLHERCIVVIGSIGGSTNNNEMSTATPEAFSASAIGLVEKFGFDGLDIDDETVGDEFHPAHTVAIVKATYEAMKKKDSRLVLTYDVYFKEGEPSFCENPENASFTRCFQRDILQYVDWINIMAYNVAKDEAIAASVYDQALTTTFAEWSKQLNGDFSRATIGVCVNSACAYGPGPSLEIIQSWKTFARQKDGGGMMIYASSGEIQNDFSVTRSLMP